MPRRPSRFASPALVVAAVLGVAGALGACQDYNFSPVNYCLIQPGTQRVTLSDISTADILFVVDDSGSMGLKQQKLADSFDAFMATLQTTNAARVSSALEPIDFHIAVTTTSVYENDPINAICTDTCGTAAGQAVCCIQTSNTPAKAPKACAADADCTSGGAGYSCIDTCPTLAGEKVCCKAGAPLLVNEPCSILGGPCGSLSKRYVFDATCVPGVSPGNGTLYPRGDFVRAGSNPRVLHFTKDLFCHRNATNTACDGPAAASATNTIATLVTQFKQNVKVGTCGSSQEQGLQAARLAFKKALGLEGLSQPAPFTPGEWPHPLRASGAADSKLVVVWVGDEDDCSSPEDANRGIVMSLPPAKEACLADSELDPPSLRKAFPVTDFGDFFSSLGRPLAGGFIVSAVNDATGADPVLAAQACDDNNCNARADCCATDCPGHIGVCTADGVSCGGVAPGVRFLSLYSALKGKLADTVAGSVCDPGVPGSLGFSSTLVRIAQVVKQPAGLSLPTQPASDALTVLRISSSDGKSTRKTCYGPAASNMTLTQAQTASPPYEWWFTAGDDANPQPTGPSKFIFINRGTPSAPFHGCEANPGETYSADYLGLVPPNGCATSADCSATFGDKPVGFDWYCCAGLDPVTKACLAPSGATRGSCLCGDRPVP